MKYCPFCRTQKAMRKRGHIYWKRKKFQRYECRSCNRTTIHPLSKKGV